MRHEAVNVFVNERSMEFIANRYLTSLDFHPKT